MENIKDEWFAYVCKRCSQRAILDYDSATPWTCPRCGKETLVRYTKGDKHTKVQTEPKPNPIVEQFADAHGRARHKLVVMQLPKILRLLAEGKSHSDIKQETGVCVETIRRIKQRKKPYDKLVPPDKISEDKKFEPLPPEERIEYERARKDEAADHSQLTPVRQGIMT